MKIVKTQMAGCIELFPAVHKDRRGSFIKMHQLSILKRCGVNGEFRESYFSESKANVLRGLHFQVPPADHSKLVYCVQGAIWDVMLDIRRDSPTYGKYHSVVLSADTGNGIFASEGFAHGFVVISHSAIVVYQVTSEYDQASDQGILWDSAGIKWPIANPVLSSRDAGFQRFGKFSSTFNYTPQL